MADPMTPERRAAIRARADAATPGPWRLMRTHQHGQPIRAEVDAGPHTWSSRTVVGVPEHPADAAFIAHARADVPDLLDHIAYLQGYIDDEHARMRSAVEGAAGDVAYEQWTAGRERDRG